MRKEHGGQSVAKRIRIGGLALPIIPCTFFFGSVILMAGADEKAYNRWMGKCKATKRARPRPRGSFDVQDLLPLCQIHSTGPPRIRPIHGFSYIARLQWFP